MELLGRLTVPATLPRRAARAVTPRELLPHVDVCTCKTHRAHGHPDDMLLPHTPFSYTPFYEH